jgi:diguanylate cyclase (GGDEF)-like protein
LCLAVVDIDYFKQVNDRFGHSAGDDVLRHLGKLLMSRFRSEDVVARWGGEEFVVGMYGMPRDAGVRRLRSFLEELSREEFRGDGDVIFHVTFSAGIAACPDDGRTVKSLFRAADQILYRAKEAGRNQVLSTISESDREDAA